MTHRERNDLIAPAGEMDRSAAASQTLGGSTTPSAPRAWLRSANQFKRNAFRRQLSLSIIGRHKSAGTAVFAFLFFSVT